MLLKRIAFLENGGFATIEGDGAAGGDAAVDTAASGAVQDRTIVEGGAAADDGGTAVAAWPENWRDMFAGDDVDAKKLIERIGTPEDLRKKLVNQERTIRSGAHKAPPALPEGATEQEVAAYRKLVGVPDKADGYGFAFPEAVTVGDGDKEVLGAFQEYMHAHHVPPGAAKAAFDFYVERMTTGNTERAAAIHEMTLEQSAELRKEFPGREFVRHFGQQLPNGQRTLGLVGDFLAGHFEGEENEKVLQQALDARLPSGLRLGDWAPYLKGMARMARSYADDEALVGGDGAGGGASVDEEYQSLINKSVDEPKKMTKADNDRLMELATARTRRDERQGRRAA